LLIWSTHRWPLPGNLADTGGIMKVEAQPSDREVLVGLVERVTYHNADNGFCVVRVKARGRGDLVTPRCRHYLGERVDQASSTVRRHPGINAYKTTEKRKRNDD
jgi:hypothetical protein